MAVIAGIYFIAVKLGTIGIATVIGLLFLSGGICIAFAIDSWNNNTEKEG